MKKFFQTNVLVVSLGIGALGAAFLVSRHYFDTKLPVGNHNKTTAVNPGAMAWERDKKK